jgi:nitroreductase
LDAAAAAPTATNSRNIRLIVLDTAAAVDDLARRTAAYYLKFEKQLNNPVVRFFISLAVGKKTVDAYKFHLPIIAERFRACLLGEQSIFYGAPLVLVAYASGLAHIASANCNLAVMQMMHKAEAMGLGTCYNGYALTALVRDKKLRQSLGIPPGSTPSAVLAVGRPVAAFHRAPKRRRPRVVSVDSNHS